jgi:hypothetical protein
MQTIDPNDPPPVPCLDLPAPSAVRSRGRPLFASARAREKRASAPRAATREPSALDALDRALQSPGPLEPAPALASDLASEPPARAPAGDLPDLATRIDEAQRQARARRVEQGLTPDADDGAYTLKRPRKHAAKRSKKHGQFLGTVSDSWQDKTRAR